MLWNISDLISRKWSSWVRMLKSHFLIYKKFTFFNPLPSVWVVDVLTKSPELRRCQTPRFVHLKKTYSYEALTAQTTKVEYHEGKMNTVSSATYIAAHVSLLMNKCIFMHNFFFILIYILISWQVPQSLVWFLCFSCISKYKMRNLLFSTRVLCHSLIINSPLKNAANLGLKIIIVF